MATSKKQDLEIHFLSLELAPALKPPRHSNHLLTLRLVCPRPTIAYKAAERTVTLADGVFAPESPKWTESVVFKETVSGRFGFAVEVTEPLSDAAAEAFVSTSASALVAGETSSKGEKFLWTYDHGDSLEPATPGSRPTGLVFDYAGRRDGLVILLK